MLFSRSLRLKVRSVIHARKPRIAYAEERGHVSNVSAFPVRPDKEQQLRARMQALGVHEGDLDEQFVRSSGPGGQHVNKVASCVILVHRPTGLRVKCQATRHQGLNRFLARRLLVEKLERQRQGVVAAEEARREKIRRQKRRRSRRARLRLLAQKRQRAEKKTARRAVDVSDTFP